MAAHRDKPPEPDRVQDQKDTQKGRWGGLSERGGRSLYAEITEKWKNWFWVDLIVKSTDGSRLEPPVVFHLDASYLKHIQYIRKVRNGTYAVFEDVSATDTFTVGAQVKDKNGAWISLEYDLSNTAGLPKRFGGSRSPQPRVRPPGNANAVSPLAILLLAANPSREGKLALEEEFKLIQDSLGHAISANRVALYSSLSTKPHQMVRAVLEHAPAVLHFSGHGNDRGIFFEGNGPDPIVVQPDSLRRFLMRRGVDLLVLNACYTSMQASKLGRATRAAIGTSGAILDVAAHMFSQEFYHWLSKGRTIAEALRAARDSVELTYPMEDMYWSRGNLRRPLL